MVGIGVAEVRRPARVVATVPAGRSRRCRPPASRPGVRRVLLLAAAGVGTALACLALAEAAHAAEPTSALPVSAPPVGGILSIPAAPLAASTGTSTARPLPVASPPVRAVEQVLRETPAGTAAGVAPGAPAASAAGVAEAARPGGAVAAPPTDAVTDTMDLLLSVPTSVVRPAPGGALPALALPGLTVPAPTWPGLVAPAVPTPADLGTVAAPSGTSLPAGLLVPRLPESAAQPPARADRSWAGAGPRSPGSRGWELNGGHGASGAAHRAAAARVGAPDAGRPAPAPASLPTPPTAPRGPVGASPAAAVTGGPAGGAGDPACAPDVVPAIPVAVGAPVGTDPAAPCGATTTPDHRPG